MAVIDYGAIAFKNGKCIQGDYFGDMLSLVGWENEELKGSYFSYVGDKDFTVCFYKTSVYVYYDGELERISLNDRFIGWKKYRGLYVTGNYTDIIAVSYTHLDVYKRQAINIKQLGLAQLGIPA